MRTAGRDRSLEWAPAYQYQPGSYQAEEICLASCVACGGIMHLPIPAGASDQIHVTTSQRARLRV
jgi:hypothetical protein